MGPEKGKISGKRTIGKFKLFKTDDEEDWEKEYVRIMNKKYSKYSRRFSAIITGKKMKNPPIFVVPRIRAGPSFKSIPLKGVDNEDVYYAPISKGFSMQEVSSFSLGPIIGEGLCLVNAAFSKCIMISHIEGGGIVDYRRKNFWRPVSRSSPERKIKLINEKYMKVDGEKVKIFEWLKENEDLWLNEWEKWRKSIALCSQGDFHWADSSPVIAYRYKKKYLNFVDWKIECYIKPSYELLPETDVIKFLLKVWKKHKIPLGLVHPKGIDEEKCSRLTEERIKEMFESPVEMCCQPYVIAGWLLGVEV